MTEKGRGRRLWGGPVNVGYGTCTTLAQHLTQVGIWADHGYSAGALAVCWHMPYAAIGSIRHGSLFSTFPTRALTGQQVICSEGNGVNKDLSSDGSAASSPSQTGQASGLRTTGMRL